MRIKEKAGLKIGWKKWVALFFMYRSPKKHLPAYLKAIRGIIRDGGYNVIHCHHAGHSVVALYYARKYHVPKRIAHAHTAIPNMRIAKKVYNLVLDTFAARFSTQLMACGHLAGECHWGKKATQRGLIRVMPNAIEMERFRFSAIERERFRKAFGVEESFVIGTVARICDQKNYPMMLNIVKSVLEKHAQSVFIVVGNGTPEEVDHTKRLAIEMGIDRKVLFLGVRDDVDCLLSMMDVFLLPSLYEGLPIVLIEAQANGLPEVISDRITREMQISDLILFESLDESADAWADALLSWKRDSISRGRYAECVQESGYDIRSAAYSMQRFYQS